MLTRMAVDRRFPDGHRSPSPRAQFRCDLCQRFVLATDHGVCPSCGREPLAMPSLHAVLVEDPVPWRYVLAVALALAFLAVLAW